MDSIPYPAQHQFKMFLSLSIISEDPEKGLSPYVIPRVITSSTVVFWYYISKYKKMNYIEK